MIFTQALHWLASNETYNESKANENTPLPSLVTIKNLPQ